MNYIGSKLSLLKFLDDSIHKVVKKNSHVFCDLFAGTGIVGSYFKKRGYRIVANDIQYYSYVLNRHYIGNHKELKFAKLSREIPALKNIKVAKRKDVVCSYLTGLDGVKGFVFKNYSPSGTKNQKNQRQYFSDENGKKCDAVRQKIEAWKNKKLINEAEYFFLLASLIESVDKLANTASVYGAFLKSLKKSAQKIFVLKPAELIINEQDHDVFNEDVNKMIRKIKGDILYLDPPYNQRQYATNYHVLETIARYDNPKIYGKTGLRDYKDQKSAYCSRISVKKAFKELVENANVKYIFLSYNNEGLMTPSDVKEIMSARGKYGCFTQNYNRYKADKGRTYKANKTVEYLHYVICK